MEINCKFFQEDINEFSWDKEALEKFKRLISEKGINCQMGDMFLLAFLRARNFDQIKSLQLLENYYNCRCQLLKYFKDLLPSKLEKILSLNIMQFMPKPDQEGRYIFVIHLANFDINVATVSEYLRNIVLCCDFQLNFHRAQEKPVSLIINSEGLTLKHLLHFTPEFFYSMVKILFSDSYPMRFQAIHYVNLNILMKAILSILFPLFPLKIKEIVHLHTEMSTLHEYVHPQYLPAEYGGELPSFDPSEMNAIIIKNEELFRMNESFLNFYREGEEEKLSEGQFKHLEENEVDNRTKNNLKYSEEKFKRVLEDPENYLSAINSEFQITAR